MRKLSAKAIAAGFTVEKFVTHTAYAKNGNSHNPTEYYVWHIRHNGERCGRAFRLKEAVAIADELLDELERTGEIK
jgi:hypothetical protein